MFPSALPALSGQALDVVTAVTRLVGVGGYPAIIISLLVVIVVLWRDNQRHIADRVRLMEAHAAAIRAENDARRAEVADLTDSRVEEFKEITKAAQALGTAAERLHRGR